MGDPPGSPEAKRRKIPELISNLMKQPESGIFRRKLPRVSPSPVEEVADIRQDIDSHYGDAVAWKKYLCVLAKLTFQIVRPTLLERVKFLIGVTELGLLSHDGNIYTWDIATESWVVMDNFPQHIYEKLDYAGKLLHGLYIVLAEENAPQRTEEYIFAKIMDLPDDSSEWLEGRMFECHVDLYHEKRTDRQWPHIQREMVTKLVEDTESMLSSPKGNDVLNHFATWCSTPKKPEQRIHFLDASLVFGDGTDVHAEEETGRNSRCYTGLQYNLFPDVSAEEWSQCEEKLDAFLKTTFFNNEAAQALWLAGERLACARVVLKRMLVIIGKGGTGKSELARLASVVWGSLYGAVDANILYDSKEFRVASAELLGKMFLNIAEVPENEKRHMAELIWKNLLTNGGINTRPNYGIKTITARFGESKWTWEMNRLPLIKTDYSAVRRRIAPIIAQARFTSNTDEVREEDGVYKMEHLDFLDDPLTGAVYIRKVFIPFCRKYSVDTCRRWVATDRGLEEMDTLFGSNLAAMRDAIASRMVDPDAPKTVDDLISLPATSPPLGALVGSASAPPWYAHYQNVLKGFLTCPSIYYKTRWIGRTPSRRQSYDDMLREKAIFEIPSNASSAITFVPIALLSSPLPRLWEQGAPETTNLEGISLTLILLLP